MSVTIGTRIRLTRDVDQGEPGLSAGDEGTIIFAQQPGKLFLFWAQMDNDPDKTIPLCLNESEFEVIE